MNPREVPTEFRLKRGSTILNYISRFSATEKAVFGLLVVIAAVAAAAMALGVNNYFMVEVPAYGGSIREGDVGLPHTINPVLAVTDVDRDLSALIYSGLMKYQNGRLMPDLAATTSVSADGLTYTFTLRDNLRFQDGSPLSTDDVAFTVQKIQDAALKSPHRADWQDVSINVISPTVIAFTLKQPYSPFLANTTVGIIPKHIWGPLSDDQFPLSRYNLEPIGSGPFKETGIDRTPSGIPSSYTVSSWNGYYGDAPYLSSITFNFYADDEKALSALENGAIDSLPSIAAADAVKLASNGGEPYTITSSPLPRIFGVFFNQNQAPVLADKNVRAALQMAVDRDAIVSQALDGYGLPIDGPLPVGMIGELPPQTSATGILPAAASTTASSSIAAARSLLEKNGWRLNPATGVYELPKKGSSAVTPLSFDIYTADTPDLKQTAAMLKQTWTALGADVNIKIFEPADLYENVIRDRKYDALLFGESIGKDRDLYAFWDSAERTAPGLNIALYTNAKVDKLLDAIRSTTDGATRQADYEQFAELIRADIPAVFLYVPDFIYAIPKSLHDVSLSSVTVPSDRFDSVTGWYNTTEKVWQIFSHSVSIH
ncbi:MAG: hypothetical protein KGI59_00435 [Patescibacteria group bacterium]|nr:hypothetical protein [Patescibacteria group bacterium]